MAALHWNDTLTLCSSGVIKDPLMQDSTLASPIRSTVSPPECPGIDHPSSLLLFGSRGSLGGSVVEGRTGTLPPCNLAPQLCSRYVEFGAA